jgi:hypothetical protein
VIKLDESIIKMSLSKGKSSQLEKSLSLKSQKEEEWNHVSKMLPVKVESPETRCNSVHTSDTVETEDSTSSESDDNTSKRRSEEVLDEGSCIYLDVTAKRSNCHSLSRSEAVARERKSYIERAIQQT